MGEKIRVNGRSLIFEQMLKMSEERLEHYRSDLYHDAMFLNELELPKEGEEVVFWYGVRPTGTTIIEDEKLYKMSSYYFDSNKWFKVTLTQRYLDAAYDMEIEAL